MHSALRLFRLLGLFLILSSHLWANTSSSTWYSLDADKQVTLNVALFLSSTCPFCHKEDAFFRDLESKTPWLHVQRFIIDKDKNALIYFNQLLTEQNIQNFAVPSAFFCNSRWVGFASAETTGKDLLNGLNYCKQQIEKKGTLSEPAINVLKRWANTNLFDSGMREHPSTVLYLSSMALIDAFNPCTFFVIATFLACLVLQSAKKKQIIGGLLFIVIVTLVHYLQQAYASTYFYSLAWLRIPAALTGFYIAFLAYQDYKGKCIFDLSLSMVCFMALMVMSYQQTCYMSWFDVFTKHINNQNLTNIQQNLYLLMYQLIYSVPLILGLFSYSMLIRIAFFAKWQAKLKNIGLLYMFAISLLLIVYPSLLSSLKLSLIILPLLFLIGWFLKNGSGLQQDGE